MSQDENNPARTQGRFDDERWREGLDSRAIAIVEILQAEAWDVTNRLGQAQVACKQIQEAYQSACARADDLEAQCEALERAAVQLHAEKVELQEAMRGELDRLAQALARLEGENQGLRFAISGGKT